MFNFFEQEKITTDFTETLTQLYTSKIEHNENSGQKNYLRYNYQNTFFDENINFFNMNGVLVFNDTLGRHLYQHNRTVKAVLNRLT